jgi:hypothetical protein
LGFFARYKIDIALIATGALIAGAFGLFEHGELKSYTKSVAGIAPLIFASIILLLVPIVGARRGLARSRAFKRVMVDVAIAAVVIPCGFLKIETALAPFELIAGTTPAEVTQRIASGDNVQQARAWARLLTLSREDKNGIAKDLAPLLLSDNEATRASASLTLDIVMRKHILVTLATLAPELRAYLEAPGADPRAERAAAFAHHFVKDNLSGIRKALEPDSRAELPPHGLEALLLALAVDEPYGHVFLRAIVDRGDAPLQTLTLDLLKQVAIAPETLPAPQDPQKA